MAGPPGGGCTSARARRARSSAAKRGSGAVRAAGRRSWENGSVIAAPGSDVRAAEGGAGAHEQRLGRVHRAVEQGGDLRHRQVVEVPQGEDGAVLRGQAVEHLLRAERVEPNLPRVVDLGALHQPETPLLAGEAAPVVDQLVPGGADQPGRAERAAAVLLRADGGEEGL